MPPPKQARPIFTRAQRTKRPTVWSRARQVQGPSTYLWSPQPRRMRRLVRIWIVKRRAVQRFWGEVKMRPEIFRYGRHLRTSPHLAQRRRVPADDRTAGNAIRVDRA